MSQSLAAAFEAFCRRRGLPIVGVSIGQPADRSTWRIQFDETATQADRDDEAAAIAAFDETVETVLGAWTEADALVARTEIAALIAVLGERLVPPVSAAQLTAEVKAKIMGV